MLCLTWDGVKHYLFVINRNIEKRKKEKKWLFSAVCLFAKPLTTEKQSWDLTQLASQFRTLPSLPVIIWSFKIATLCATPTSTFASMCACRRRSRRDVLVCLSFYMWQGGSLLKQWLIIQPDKLPDKKFTTNLINNLPKLFFLSVFCFSFFLGGLCCHLTILFLFFFFFPTKRFCPPSGFSVRTEMTAGDRHE